MHISTKHCAGMTFCLLLAFNCAPKMEVETVRPLSPPVVEAPKPVEKTMPQPSTPKPAGDKRGYVLPPTPPHPDELSSAETALKDRPEDFRTLRATGTLYQQLSAPDHWDRAERAVDLLQQAHRQFPDDPQTNVFLGLAKASRAKKPKTSIFEKPKIVKDALTFIDRGVEADANNFSLRLMRAKMQLLLPPIIGRNEQLKSDHAWVQMQTETENMPTHLRAAALIFLGDYQKRFVKKADQAKDLWRKAAEIESAYRADAQARLNGEDREW